MVTKEGEVEESQVEIMFDADEIEISLQDFKAPEPKPIDKELAAPDPNS